MHMQDARMKAIAYRRYGSAQVLEWLDLPRPSLKTGQVLVKVQAAALNPVDVEFRKGRGFFLQGLRFPKIPGSDFAGELVESRAAAIDWAPGTPVFGMSPTWRGGTYAGYIAVDADHLAHSPSGLGPEEAAALPLVSLTALQALRDLAGLSAGQSVFIHGGSGGLGTAAIQIARYFDAQVTSSCSYRNVDRLYKLGAQEVIDYTKNDLTRISGGYDCYFDVYGNMPFSRVKHLLRPGGVHVSSIPSPGNFLAALGSRLMGSRHSHVVIVQSRRTDLDSIRKLVEGGQLRPVIDRQYPLPEARQAQEYLETRRAGGKIILKVPPEAY